MEMYSSDNSDFSQTIYILKIEQTFYKGVVNFDTFLFKHWNRCNGTESKKENHYTGRIQIDMQTKCPANVANFMTIKVAVHTSDVLWNKNMIKTHSQASLSTSCIVHLFNPIELWSIAMHYGGQ